MNKFNIHRWNEKEQLLYSIVIHKRERTAT